MTTTTAADLDEETIARYRRDGFVRVRQVLTPDEVAEYHAAAVAAASRLNSRRSDGIFSQIVNVWRDDEAMRRLTLNPRIAALAERLAGVPLKLWHDQILIKEPHNARATHFHQDQPYWPHAGSAHPISAWIALCDVPVERGCMSFLPGSHARTDLPAQNLGDGRSLFALAPDLAYSERVTLPLRAGDCTFHHGRCAHMATPNETDEPRVAHTIIFMDAATVYNGRPHVVTDPLGLTKDQPIEGELFPRASAFAG